MVNFDYMTPTRLIFGKDSIEKLPEVMNQFGPKILLTYGGGSIKKIGLYDKVKELLADTCIVMDTSFSTGAMVPLPDGYWKPEDLPMLSQEDFMGMVEVFGPERILFGTDSPWSDQSACLEFLGSLPLPPDDLSAILGGNAQRFLLYGDRL